MSMRKIRTKRPQVEATQAALLCLPPVARASRWMRAASPSTPRVIARAWCLRRDSRRSSSGIQRRLLSDPELLLAEAYSGLPDGFEIGKSDRDRVHAAHGSSAAGGSFGAATYGEVRPQGVAMLVEALQLNSADSTFYDLGSGRGAAVLQVALRSDVGPRRAVGVELSHERHAVAAQAFERLAALAPNVRSRAAFICADLATADWHREATAVLCTNLLFGNALNHLLQAQLARCDTLRRVVTLRPVAEQAARLRLVGLLKLPVTWASHCRAYVYERNRK